MANKGGAIGDTLGTVLTAVGDAVIPQTMNNFRNIEQQKRNSFVSDQASKMLLGDFSRTPTPAPLPKINIGEDGSVSESRSAAPQPRPMGGGLLGNTGRRLGLLSTALGPQAVLSAVAPSMLSQMFPAGPSKDDFITGPFGAFNIKNNQMVPGTAPQVKPPELPSDVQTAMWMAGGDPVKAREVMAGWKSKADGERAPPAGYAWTPDGSLKPIPGGPADPDNKPEAAPPAGYRKSADGNLEPIPGGPADIGQKGLPQKYKDQVAAIDQFEGTLGEYEKLLNEVGTEYWDSKKAARLDSLQTQMKFGIKGIEQTGALDRGSIEVMDGMIPDATGFRANIDPLGRGAGRAKARVGELRNYVSRAKVALEKGYKTQAEGSGGRPEIGTVEDGYRYKGGDPANPNSWEQL